FNIDYGPNSTRDYKIRKILESQEGYRSPPRARPEVFPISTPTSKRSRGSPQPSPPSSEHSFVPPDNPNRWKPSPIPSPIRRAQGIAEAAYIGSKYLPKPPPRRANLSEYELPKPPPIAV
ncbi:MAG: hypothetical protein ACKPKO_16875, partial [Candidatus Fonsibacter sp.]